MNTREQLPLLDAQELAPKTAQLRPLPAGWKYVKLGEVCETSSGGTPSRKVPEFFQGDIPWVRSGELNFNIIRDTEEKISPGAIENSSAKVFPTGTLLIALYGATIGKLAILGIDAATNQAVCGIFENDHVTTRFLYHLLFFRRPDLIKRGTGGAQPNISQTILGSLIIPLPPLSEQHRIVAKIEELFSEIDKGVEQLQAARAQLKVYRQAVLKWAFEGKLTEKWRAEQPHLPSAEALMELIRTEREKTYREACDRAKTEGTKPPKKLKELPPLTAAELAELPELPEGWGWVKLGAACEKVFDGAHFSPSNSATGKYKYITAKNIKIWGIDLSNITYVSEQDHRWIYERCDVKKNDILYIKDGATTGIAAINNLEEQFSLLSSVGVFRVNTAFINPMYVVHFLNSAVTKNRMLKSIAGVAITRLTLAKLNDSLLVLPSLEEQHAIVHEIEARLSVCDSVERTIEESLQRAEALRQSILKRAFEGKLVPQQGEQP